VQRFRDGLVFKAHRLLYDSTPGLRVIKKRRRRSTKSVRGSHNDATTFSSHQIVDLASWISGGLLSHEPRIRSLQVENRGSYNHDFVHCEGLARDTWLCLTWVDQPFSTWHPLLLKLTEVPRFERFHSRGLSRWAAQAKGMLNFRRKFVNFEAETSGRNPGEGLDRATERECVCEKKSIA